MNSALRKILVALSLVSAGMAIYYFISLIIAGDFIHGFVAATSYAVCMLCGAIIGLMAEYTVRMKRNNTDDKNQLNAGIILPLGLGRRQMPMALLCVCWWVPCRICILKVIAILAQNIK